MNSIFGVTEEEDDDDDDSDAYSDLESENET